MRFSKSISAHNEASSSLLATGLIVCSILTTFGALSAHSLATNAGSWALVWIYSKVKGHREGSPVIDNAPRRKLCWAVGLLFVLSQVCERAVGGGEALAWAKAFLPVTVLLLQALGLKSNTAQNADLGAKDEGPRRGPKALILIATAAAFTVLVQPSASPPSIALGLCFVLLSSLAYSLLEEALHASWDDRSTSDGGFVSADGSLMRLRPSPTSSKVLLTSLGHVSGVASIGSALGVLAFESMRQDGISFQREFDGLTGSDWKKGQWVLNVAQGVAVALAGAVKGVLMVIMIRRNGAVPVGFIDLGAALFSNLATTMSIAAAFFSLLSTSSAWLYVAESTAAAAGRGSSRRRIRLKQLVSVVALVSFVMFALGTVRQSYFVRSDPAPPPPIDRAFDRAPEPKKPADTRSHPIYQLINTAEKDFEAVKGRQSKSLAEAVAEYRRRYRLPPPPNFDKWYEFAKKKDVQLIDEFDAIYHSLQPFWGLDPATIRARGAEALGFDNALLGMAIRRGQATLVEGGGEWQQKAIVGMIQDFVIHLPDMDLAFNSHDEPRVVVPHDDLSRLLGIAKGRTMPEAYSNPSPQNSFSSRPKYLTNGESFRQFKVTRFNRYAHQPTWLPSRLSCAPDTPARSLRDDAPDDVSAWALGELGFIYNSTAYTDVCLSPSFRESFGFFDRPNAFDVVHDLFPIFSQSKVSSFQDILYPSPWYWYGKVKYDEGKDYDWEKKESKLYWRGSTTGGFSRDGGWRRQHRQQVVSHINALDHADIMHNQGRSATSADWQTRRVKRHDYAGLFDVRFSHIGQCDPGDCDAQREFFSVAKTADQQDAWRWRFLLDMDGNAFSGRFYAFLKSRSLVYKMAIFREWHQDWLKPWVHYIPLSLRGDEHVESVRYFAGEDEGKAQAPRLGVQGREWANRVLRNEDIEVWFFRLLLEYGRVIDDNREKIGYAGP
ncbi:MAG: hypothetical protein M1825_006483 [Sarcosagium campestre]|nr:MAG: hypothetical protein M1825_006483 [Sarcosagium campestre]